MEEIYNLLKTYNKEDYVVEEDLEAISFREFNELNKCRYSIKVLNFDKVSDKFSSSQGVSSLKSVDAILCDNEGNLLLIEMKTYSPYGKKSLPTYVEDLFKDGEGSDSGKICCNCGMTITKCTKCNQPKMNSKCGYCGKELFKNDRDGNVPKKLIDTICTLASIWKHERKEDISIIEKLIVSNKKIIPILLLDASDTDYYPYCRNQRIKNMNSSSRDWLKRSAGNASLILENEVYILNCTAFDWYLKDIYSK